MVFSCEKLMTHFSLILTAFLLFHLICLPPTEVNATPADEAVGKWAMQFGEELWQLAKRMTKSQEIKAKYKEFNARVESKDGNELIQSITDNVGKMFTRKIKAVHSIMERAENVYEQFVYNKTEAQKFTYYSSKFSKFENESAEELLEVVEILAHTYKDFMLNPDTHFYDISVNTNHSSVHVPSNVFDRYDHVLKAIMWSEELDDVFRRNYASDPALSWQYFGSDTGILRHYPASKWQEQDDDNADTYDCRKRSWYIETATCSKDIVILMDVSGSMRGFSHHVSKFTIRNIMNTFSNNDFFTVMSYSREVTDIVECFEDTLVQATPENIEVFDKALEDTKPYGYANLNAAYEKAFKLLKKYYIKRRCNETMTCNQAIMLITDGVIGNSSVVFEKYNWGNGENGTDRMKVRIFTYQLGKEDTKEPEIQYMACLNRGFYSHVATLDEAQEEALKYVDVIATPLVLQDLEHPPTWTHSSKDLTSLNDNKTEARLMIAVGVPAFDRSYLHENATKEQRRARLLGVAGTDVPVNDIDKLTLPYKLGVNGYSFVISNNGYVVLHPDLRLISQNKKENPNYNSIDLTEVEHMFHDTGPRQPGDSIIEIRKAMVFNTTGSFKDISVKFHYDKMRRISEEKQDYFFAPLPNTPFSLGIVLPSDYGKTWIKVGEEVLKNIHMKVNISDFFLGENWKIHPDWIYCKYHYLEGHEYDTPEEELLDFLKIMVRNDWQWSEQYDAAEGTELGQDDYYCNKELVQLLIFDAKVTNSSYGEWEFTDDNERRLIESFNATLRFVATMSGLTRWQFIYGEVEVETDQEFGDYHKSAIDETWYKSAILQHRKERTESFVYSVKHADDPKEDDELKVTASHAIFPRDGGNEAPACVVGFQFSHVKMYERFKTITEQENCNGCIPTCDKDDIECYVIDNNAYVLISQYINETGRFFGETKHGDVMDSMVQKGIYLKIDMYDYQNMCLEDADEDNSAHSLLHPLTFIKLGFEWLITELFWYWTRIQLWADGAPFLEYETEIQEDYDTVPVNFHQIVPKVNDEDAVYKPPPPEPIFNPCDTVTQLYVLRPNSLEGINDKISVPGAQSFWVKKIPNTNLLLVIINVLEPHIENKLHSTKLKKYEYDKPFPCYKLQMSEFERRRLEECYTEHDNEKNFTYCGDATALSLKSINLVITILIYFTASYLYI